MYKIIAALFALFALAAANPSVVGVGISGLSATQRIQSHVPVGVVGVGVPALGVAKVGGLGLGLGSGLVGTGLGLGTGLVGSGLGLGLGAGLVGTGLGLGGVGIIG